MADQGELAKREQVKNFRKWIGDNLPPDQARRAWQLLESLVFISNPNLAGTRFYATRTGSTEPIASNYPDDGFGLWIDNSAGDAYVVVQWQGIFYVVGSGSGGGGPVTADYDDISANDPATDVSGAELEELTDSSETALHSHAEVPTTADYNDISANDPSTDVAGAELEELTDGSLTALHSHADDCPEYKYIKALAQSEGNLHLSDAVNWDTSLALIKSINVNTLSTDWDVWILQNDNGYAADDANIPATKFMGGGNGSYVIEFDLPYEDEDASDEVHLYIVDNSGSNTFDVFVLGYGLK